ncbi:hypothetical protein ILUMI_26756 [Ignelater luminosus]|uniref:Uncharacterized protein n=1 Tax=Ignelater luminosus TaxID=2038154 RepID=A0A8K0C441_IGNLU|nr:hypothetical protein ILUMI_26756 [Ignelater luminosus]
MSGLTIPSPNEPLCLSFNFAAEEPTITFDLSLNNAEIDAGVEIKIDQSIPVTNEIPESEEELFDSDDNFILSESSNEENILEDNSNAHKNNKDQNVEADQEAMNKKKAKLERRLGNQDQ